MMPHFLFEPGDFVSMCYYTICIFNSPSLLVGEGELQQQQQKEEKKKTTRKTRIFFFFHFFLSFSSYFWFYVLISLPLSFSVSRFLGLLSRSLMGALLSASV